MVSKIEKVADIDTHVKTWDIDQPKAGILVVHGYAEHISRYDHVASFFNDQKYVVRGFDFLGHGKSEGRKGLIGDFGKLEEQLDAVANAFASEYPGIPICIMGHSMGGLVVASSCIKGKLKDFDNIILTNPGLDIASNQPKILVSLVRLLAKVIPTFPTVKLKSDHISRDPEVRKDYDNDPLNYRGGSIPIFVDQFDKAGKWTVENAGDFKKNLLLCYSNTDKVVYPEASEIFFKAVASKDKTIQEFPGLYHELLNEPEKEEVMECIRTWCNKRL